MIGPWAVAVWLAASPPHAPAERGAAFSGAQLKHPVEITADRLEIQGKKSQAVWSGHVKAVRGTTHLSCNRLVAHYSKAQEITRIECLGDVEATDGDRWAKGDRADFDNVTGILDVTGSPEARQGKNHMRGTKVTFDVTKDTVEVQNAVTLFETSAQGTPDLPKAGSKKKKAP